MKKKVITLTKEDISEIWRYLTKAIQYPNPTIKHYPYPNKPIEKLQSICPHSNTDIVLHENFEFNICKYCGYSYIVKKNIST